MAQMMVTKVMVTMATMTVTMTVITHSMSILHTTFIEGKTEDGDWGKSIITMFFRTEIRLCLQRFFPALYDFSLYKIEEPGGDL